MRFAIITSLALVIAIGTLAGCNSKDSLISQAEKTVQNQPLQTTQTPAPDNARRITAEELHKLWEKTDVLIIDTRGEAGYKKEDDKRADSVPSNHVGKRIDEPPRNKVSGAYCP